MILEMLRSGGFGMYPTTLFGAVLLALSVRFARAPERRGLPLIVAMNGLTLASGALGFVTGIVTMCGGLAAPFVGERERIAYEGVRESAYPLTWALLIIVVAALASAIGAWKLSGAAPAQAA